MWLTKTTNITLFQAIRTNAVYACETENKLATDFLDSGMLHF